MREIFAVGDAVQTANNEVKLLKLFDSIRDEQLHGTVQGYGDGINSGSQNQKNLSKHLHGEQLSVEDIALCCLAGPAVLPRNYCEGRFTKYFDRALENDEQARRRVEVFRKHDVGQYVNSVYENCRMAATATATAQ